MTDVVNILPFETPQRDYSPQIVSLMWTTREWCGNCLFRWDFDPVSEKIRWEWKTCEWVLLSVWYKCENYRKG